MTVLSVVLKTVIKRKEYHLFSIVVFLWYHNDSGQRIQDTLRFFWEKVGAQQCLGWDDMPIRHELT